MAVQIQKKQNNPCIYAYFMVQSTIRIVRKTKEWVVPLFYYYEVKPLAQKKKSGNTVTAVTELCKPFAQQLGLTLWDVRYVKEGSYWYLRVFIDKPGGVTLDDCEAMSRAINDPLDRLDPIDGEYCLEVCSPGVDRELTRPEHFQAFLGAVVTVRLIRPLQDGTKEILGILQAFENPILTLETEDGQVLEIDKKDTSSIRVCDDYIDIEDEYVEEEM